MCFLKLTSPLTFINRKKQHVEELKNLKENYIKQSSVPTIYFNTAVVNRRLKNPTSDSMSFCI